MSNGRALVRSLLLVAAAAILVAVAWDLRRRLEIADATTQDIENQLAELDPVTRAAVLAKLSANATEHVKESRQKD